MLMTTLTPEGLSNFFKYYSGEPQQVEAIQRILYTQMPESLLNDTTSWISKFREKPPLPRVNNPIDVPYFYQLDNPSTQGYRECFSTSCAMIAAFHGAIKTENEYHAIRPKFGDSTEVSAQIRTLNYFGLDAEFVQTGGENELREEINKGYPVAVGFLHHGSYLNPSSGGHYAVALGHNSNGFIFNDPFGNFDAQNGLYLDHKEAKNVCYPYKFWLPRWSVANDHDGWALKCRPR